MTESPLISVIVPVYQAEESLHHCVESLLSQTYTNLDIILVNDGSTDSSGPICDSFAEKDPRVRVFHQANKGQSAARNKGLSAAKGDYLGFVDSDDWVSLNMYETLLDVIHDYQLDVVECHVSHELKYTPPGIQERGEIIVEDRNTLLKRIVKNQYFSVCRRIYSKELVARLKFKEGLFAEDVYYTMEMLFEVDRIALISNPFYKYYKAGVSTTRGPFKLKALGTIDAALFVEKMIPEKYKDEELTLIIERFILTILLFNYKSLHYYPQLDPEKEHRKRVKKLLQNYLRPPLFTPSFLLAGILPIWLYQALIKTNMNLKKLR